MRIAVSQTRERPFAKAGVKNSQGTRKKEPHPKTMDPKLVNRSCGKC